MSQFSPLNKSGGSNNNSEAFKIGNSFHNINRRKGESSEKITSMSDEKEQEIRKAGKKSGAVKIIRTSQGNPIPIKNIRTGNE